MKKSEIKYKLRENLMSKLTETEPKEAPAKKHGSNYEKDYSEVQRKLDGTVFKASQVMGAAGLGSPDNASDRSLFSKKLRKEKNDEGGQYLFNTEDLAQIIKVINNPSPHL
jgi:hypothetical protein